MFCMHGRKKKFGCRVCSTRENSKTFRRHLLGRWAGAVTRFRERERTRAPADPRQSSGICTPRDARRTFSDYSRAATLSYLTGNVFRSATTTPVPHVGRHFHRPRTFWTASLRPNHAHAPHANHFTFLAFAQIISRFLRLGRKTLPTFLSFELSTINIYNSFTFLFSLSYYLFCSLRSCAKDLMLR